MAIQEQELKTKEMHRRREKDILKRRLMDVKCTVCGQSNESGYHLVCSCPALAPSLYLNVRHNNITRMKYQELIQSENLIMNPPKITKIHDQEI